MQLFELRKSKSDAPTLTETGKAVLGKTAELEYRECPDGRRVLTARSFSSISSVYAGCVEAEQNGNAYL